MKPLRWSAGFALSGKDPGDADRMAVKALTGCLIELSQYAAGRAAGMEVFDAISIKIAVGLTVCWQSLKGTCRGAELRAHGGSEPSAAA